MILIYCTTHLFQFGAVQESAIGCLFVLDRVGFSSLVKNYLTVNLLKVGVLSKVKEGAVIPISPETSPTRRRFV